MLLVVLSRAGLTVRPNVGWVAGVVAVTFGLRLWPGRRAHGHRDR